jgi:hypothetical protein
MTNVNPRDIASAMTRSNDGVMRVPPVRSPAAAARGPDPSRIQLDSSLRRWFSRNLGLWRSRRLYFFSGEDEALRVDMLLRIEGFSEPVEGEAAYRFTWWPERDYGFFDRQPRFVPSGTMEAYLCGHQLRRSRGYLCGSPVKTQIRQVDEHELVFESHYLEWDVLEHIRLVDQDRYRARSIYSWRDGDLELSEIHHEIRLEGAGIPLAGN